MQAHQLQRWLHCEQRSGHPSGHSAPGQRARPAATLALNLIWTHQLQRRLHHEQRGGHPCGHVAPGQRARHAARPPPAAAALPRRIRQEQAAVAGHARGARKPWRGRGRWADADQRAQRLKGSMVSAGMHKCFEYLQQAVLRPSSDSSHAAASVWRLAHTVWGTTHRLVWLAGTPCTPCQKGWAA